MIKRLIISHLMVISASLLYADDATKIVSEIELRILPPVSEKFEPKDKREAEIVRRNNAQKMFNEIFADYLRKTMNNEELKAVLDFVKTPAGNKLFKSFHSEEFEKLGNRALKVYQDTEL
jgi:hypothetical protein